MLVAEIAVVLSAAAVSAPAVLTIFKLPTPLNTPAEAAVEIVPPKDAVRLIMSTLVTVAPVGTANAAALLTIFNVSLTLELPVNLSREVNVPSGALKTCGSVLAALPQVSIPVVSEIVDA